MAKTATNEYPPPNALVLIFVSVCAVCADGYARGVGYTCTQCSGSRRTVTITVVLALLVAAMLITVVVCAKSAECSVAEKTMTTTTSLFCGRLRTSLSRFECTKASQALKIVIVAWQIVTQASKCPNAKNVLNILLVQMVLFEKPRMYWDILLCCRGHHTRLVMSCLSIAPKTSVCSLLMVIGAVARIVSVESNFSGYNGR